VYVIKHTADFTILYQEERVFFQMLLRSQMFAVFADEMVRAQWEKEIEQKEKVLEQILDMIGEEGRQQAGIVSVLKILETLNEKEGEEVSKLEATLQQSSERIGSLISSKKRVESELQQLRSKLAGDQGTDL